MHNEPESPRESFEPDRPRQSLAGSFLVFLSVAVVVSFIAIITYTVIGLPGIVIGAVLLAAAFFEFTFTWLLEVTAKGAGNVVSRTVVLLRRQGVIPDTPQLSETTIHRLKGALLVSLLIAAVWLTHRLILDR